MEHITVLLNESVDGLNIKHDGLYVDGTLGGGGHSLEIAKRLDMGRLICIDKDDYAHERAKERLAKYLDKITFVKNDFANIGEILDDRGVNAFDGMLLDLGVSSFQLDDSQRGFSYSKKAPLDMRMDRTGGISAYDVVNTYSEEDLANIIFKYGEERFSRRIAGAIVRKRGEKMIDTTTELADIVLAAIPKQSARGEAQHPARRTFQAIRIEVNSELAIIENSILEAFKRLSVGGRLAIITFHSLEDRIVKTTFVALAQGCKCPPDFPICVCNNKPKGKIITKKPILPSEEELSVNPRSRSAKLRIFEKILTK